VVGRVAVRTLKLQLREGDWDWEEERRPKNCGTREARRQEVEALQLVRLHKAKTSIDFRLSRPNKWAV
jgi:hypothetical protein